jgi:diadenosine tetraphosphate (Ap4A) HIT family hydrolase
LNHSDINPTAPVHSLVIPKRKIARIADAQDDDAETLGRCLVAASRVAKSKGLSPDGYRLVINDGKNGCMLLIEALQALQADATPLHLSLSISPAL